MSAPWMTNKWMNGGSPVCALSCCAAKLVGTPHEGQDGKLYCDEFCEADAAAIADIRARDPTRRAS